MHPGEIYRAEDFYVTDKGELAPKYLLVLAVPAGDNIVVRLLTSRAHGRPETPPCYHGRPYGGFFLGTPGASLTEKTWIDLRAFDDLDPVKFDKRKKNGTLTHSLSLSRETLRAVLECVAASDDTTNRQEKHLRDTLAALR